MDINALRNQLRRGIVNITFTKVDGTERVMNATLSELYLPEEFRGQNFPVKEGRAVSVWDVDAKSWRAFRPDSIKVINGLRL